jgi:hypothetical protein
MSKVLELPATREEFQHWSWVVDPTMTTWAEATCSPVQSGIVSSVSGLHVS